MKIKQILAHRGVQDSLSTHYPKTASPSFESRV